MGKYPECSSCSCSGPGCGFEHTPEAYQREREFQESIEQEKKARLLSIRRHAESIVFNTSEEMRLAAYGNSDVHDIRQIAHKGMEQLLALIPRQV